MRVRRNRDVRRAREAMRLSGDTPESVAVAFRGVLNEINAALKRSGSLEQALKKIEGGSTLKGGLNRPLNVLLERLITEAEDELGKLEGKAEKKEEKVQAKSGTSKWNPFGQVQLALSKQDAESTANKIKNTKQLIEIAKKTAEILKDASLDEKVKIAAVLGALVQFKKLKRAELSHNLIKGASSAAYQNVVEAFNRFEDSFKPLFILLRDTKAVRDINSKLFSSMDAANDQDPVKDIFVTLLKSPSSTLAQIEALRFFEQLVAQGATRKVTDDQEAVVPREEVLEALRTVMSEAKVETFQAPSILPAGATDEEEEEATSEGTTQKLPGDTTNPLSASTSSDKSKRDEGIGKSGESATSSPSTSPSPEAEGRTSFSRQRTGAVTSRRRPAPRPPVAQPESKEEYTPPPPPPPTDTRDETGGKAAMMMPPPPPLPPTDDTVMGAAMPPPPPPPPPPLFTTVGQASKPPKEQEGVPPAAKTTPPPTAHPTGNVDLLRAIRGERDTGEAVNPGSQLKKPKERKQRTEAVVPIKPKTHEEALAERIAQIAAAMRHDSDDEESGSERDWDDEDSKKPKKAQSAVGASAPPEPKSLPPLPPTHTQHHQHSGALFEEYAKKPGAETPRPSVSGAKSTLPPRRPSTINKKPG